MKRKLFPLTFLLVSLVFHSCHNKENLEKADIQFSEIKTQSPADNNSNSPDQKIPVGKTLPATDSVAGPQGAAPSAHIDWDKKIIKIANLKLEVTDFKQYNAAVHQAVRRHGGYIAQEEQTLADEKLSSVIAIKVPVESFETLMGDLPGNDSKVLESNITSQDVTGEVIDTRSRMEAKRQARLKYLDFLKASKNMEEVLKVQEEINDIQEEIEAAAGRVQYLTHASAFSTINLSFYQPVAGFVPANDQPSFITRVATSFKLGAEWITDLLVGIVAIWPLLLIGFGLFFLYKRRNYFKTNPQKP